MPVGEPKYGRGVSELRFSVVGVEHPHVFSLVQGLIDAGGVEVGHAAAPGPLTDHYRSWRPTSPELATADALTADVDVVVLAGVPADRAGHAITALTAGASVLSDKPGVITTTQLDEVVAAERTNPGRWWVLFSERFGNRATLHAIRLVHEGRIGSVVDVVGLGPHALAGASRPDWFWSPITSGGILADLATHQIDQFCSLVDPFVESSIEVIDAAVGNVASPSHPEMQDVGRLTLAGAGAVGTHRVDYLSAPGLGTWGDCRLMVAGTEGSIEVRANVDPSGREGAEHLIVVDTDGTHRIDITSVELDWAIRLAADIATGSDTLMSSAHVERVCRLAVEAQALAHPWPSSAP